MASPHKKAYAYEKRLAEMRKAGQLKQERGGKKKTTSDKLKELLTKEKKPLYYAAPARQAKR